MNMADFISLFFLLAGIFIGWTMCYVFYTERKSSSSIFTSLDGDLVSVVTTTKIVTLQRIEYRKDGILQFATKDYTESSYATKELNEYFRETVLNHTKEE